MKRILVVLIPLAIIGGLVYWRLQEKRATAAAMQQQRQARAKAPVNVATALAQVRDVVNTFDATATLEAPLNVKIAPKVQGRIEYLEVHEGDRVTRGQVLVRIDRTQVEADVRQARAQLSEAEYRLAQAQIAESPTNVNIYTQIRQQAAGVASARADYNQTRQNLSAQEAAADAAVADTQGRIDSATASIAGANASVSSAQANAANAHTKYDRLAFLLKKGGVSQQEVDDARTSWQVLEGAVDVANQQLQAAMAVRDSARAQKRASQEQARIVRTKGGADVESARQRLAQAEAALQYARANRAQTPAYRKSLAALQSTVDAARAAVQSNEARRADTVLLAPMDGYVTARSADPGTTAQPGQAILTLQSFRDIWVSFPVPDTVGPSLSSGTEVTVTFDAIPGQRFTADVVQINPSADPQGRQFTIRAAMKNAEGYFKPGMFAHVLVETARAGGVVAVPREAVLQDRQGSYVMVISDDTAHHRAVTTGLSDAAFITITRGVNAGEKVVTVASRPVKDGDPVTSGGATKGGGAGKGGAKAGKTP